MQRDKGNMMLFICNIELLKTVTMNEISSGSARHPEGSIDAGFDLRHKVGDRTFLDAILLIMFNPEISCGKKHFQLGQNIKHQLL